MIVLIQKSLTMSTFVMFSPKLAPEEKISIERQLLEFNALKLMNSIQPGSAPEPYCLDTKHNMSESQSM